MQRGAQDQRCTSLDWNCKSTLPLSSRSDVLVYQTPPLEQDTEVTGRLIVKLWASSDGPDTDFTAKLIDVYPPNPDYPAGIDLNIGDSIVRARYRESLEHRETPGSRQPAEFTIETLSDLTRLPARTPYSARHLQFQLSPLRRQSQYRRTPRPGTRAPCRPEHGLSRSGPPFRIILPIVPRRVE